MPKAPASVSEISIEEFDEMIENHDDLLVVDVRDAAEFQRGHIPGARLIPREMLEETMDDARRLRLDKLLGTRQRTLVLCSQDGSHSAAPVHMLQQMGFEKVYSLTGGINRWKARGFALVTE